MVHIAAHHKNDAYKPQCDWPGKAYVQWGGNGIVVSGDGSAYRTAFFEVFPKDNASSLIRGEGATIVDAGRAAFSQWRKPISPAGNWLIENSNIDLTSKQPLTEARGFIVREHG